MNDLNFRKLLQEKWNIEHLPVSTVSYHEELLDEGKIKNMFVFGEDPIGCATDKTRIENWFNKADFILIQDYFMTNTAKKADLILPSSLPLEIDGTYTNAQKIIQEFHKQRESAVEKTSIEQLLGLLQKFGSNGLSDVEDVKMEIASLLPINESDKKIFFHTTDIDNYNRVFDYGCDSVVKIFNEEFEESFN